MLAAVALGFSLASAHAAEPAARMASAAFCDPGVYELYNSSGEFVGVLWVKSDCTYQVIWAQQ
jgi:hypothetical protein